MKYDWKYVTTDRAQMNVALIAAEVINKLADENETEQIIGACRLMNAIMDSLEEKESGDDQ